MFKVIDLFLAAGFAWIILGITLLITNRKSLSMNPINGILILMVFGLTLIDNFIKPGMLNPSSSKLLFSVLRSSYFLVGPTLWFYCIVLFNEESNNNKLQLLHFLPFLLAIVFSLFFDKSPQIPLERMIRPPMNSHDNFLFNAAKIKDFLSIISRVIYSVFVIYKITKRSKHVKDFYSNLSSRNTLSWLFYITLFYLILFLLNSLLITSPISIIVNRTGISTFVRVAPSVIFVFFFAIFSQKQPVPEDKKGKKENKYKKSGLNSGESEMIFKSLNKVLIDKKLYNDPDFNLDLLAEEIGETRHRVSETLNKHANENFYSFINRYRLDDFILSIKENRYPNYTILAIAYECGFKSSSAFYSFFKKQMNMTPKEYLKMEKVS